MFAKIKKNSLHPTKPQRKSNDQRVNVKTRERKNKRDGEIRKPTPPPQPDFQTARCNKFYRFKPMLEHSFVNF